MQLFLLRRLHWKDIINPQPTTKNLPPLPPYLSYEEDGGGGDGDDEPVGEGDGDHVEELACKIHYEQLSDDDG